MSLLSSSRLEAIRLIREQLRCTLCGNIFQDPQCLDCKHNFCHSCILLHLKQNNSHCPSCRLPTRPSEVTRNQFLESILAAWKGVETELESLTGDKSLHATEITVQDTDRAFHRAANGAGATHVSDDTQHEERQSSRGRVANHKWNIDTQEIRLELKLEQPYLPQTYGAQSGSTAHWKKTSSSDLPDDYGGSAVAVASSGNIGNIGNIGNSGVNGHRRESDKKPAAVSLDEASTVEIDEVEEEEKKEENGSLSPRPNSLMATQEVESYLDRITKQRQALSQWERDHHGNGDGNGKALLELERSLHSSAAFNELLKERRRDSQQHHDDDGDLLTQMSQMTQMPPATSALESPDLLASFRRRHSDNHDERRPGAKSKRQMLLSPLPLHSQRRLSSPSRKRLRMPSLQSDFTTGGHTIKSAIDLSRADSDDEDTPTSAIDLSRVDSDDEESEVPDSQPATMLPDEEEKESDEDEEEEEEYEMKPAAPLPPSPEPKNPPPSQHCERLSSLFSRKKDRASDDFRSAITAFQSEEKHVSNSPKSQAAKQLVRASSNVNTEAVALAANRARDIIRPSSAGSVSKPPIHSSNGNAKATGNTDSGSGFVFVSSDLTREEVKRILEATQLLGGKFGHDFDLKRDPVSGHFCTSVTHLVTKAVPPIGAPNGTEPVELRCKRTAKYMRALAEGSFIMDFTWITGSLSAGRWLTEEPFEMIGDIYSDAIGKPHEGRVRRVQTGRRNSIFSMFCFVLLVSEKEFDFQFASVKSLVNNFGGTVVHGESYAKLNPKQRTRRTPVGVVSKTTSPWDAKAKWQQFQIPIVRITWIFDSVSHLEVLPFDDYYPY
ncbi:hypothetical protein PR003_g3914 [Phytophthora rubi]|uniref:RING-type E3 ubiquitin transferase BRCA1 n=1 Tax=Phytophthora rubi TaxID=129364 RepID=A0A6A4FWF1_9STRA|nr:hypothetical protein PR003_g3914 [Phytophthora rubi]